MLKNAKLSNLFIFLGFVVLLCFTYWPAISSHYFFHDDVIFFLRTYIRRSPPGTFFALAMGRFIGAFLFTGLSWIVNCIDDLKIVRFLSIMQLSVLGVMLTIWIKKYFFNFFEAKFLALLVLTLPPFQILACQSGMGQHPFSMLFSVGSFVLAYGLPLAGSFPKRLFHLRFLGSVFLFLCGLSVFQPGAMFYWALVGFVVLFEKEDSFNGLRQRIFNLFATGFFSLILYRVILQLTSRFFIQYELHAYNPYAINTDVIGKAFWYFREPVFYAMNLWNIFANVSFVFVTMFIVLAGLMLKAAKHLQKKDQINITKFLFKVSVFVAVLFLSSLPNLVVTENLMLVRCFAGLWALVLFLWIWAFREILSFFSFFNKNNFFAIGIFFLSLFGMFQANRTVWLYRVNLSVQETRFFMNFFRKEHISRYQRIYIVAPDPERFRTIADEYGNLTTFYEHNAYGLVACALREIFKEEFDIYHIMVDPPNEKMLFLFSQKGQKKPFLQHEVIVQSGRQGKGLSDFSEPTLIIDMNRFRPNPAKVYLKSSM